MIENLKNTLRSHLTFFLTMTKKVLILALVATAVALAVFGLYGLAKLALVP